MDHNALFELYRNYAARIRVVNLFNNYSNLAINAPLLTATTHKQWRLFNEVIGISPRLCITKLHINKH